MNLPLKTTLSHFDKIYVVTLRRSTDRQARINELLEGIPFEFFYGADGKDLDPTALERDGVIDGRRIVANHLEGAALQVGEIGCSLSHRALYEKIGASSLRSTLILEDDVEVGTYDVDRFEQALQELPADWDLLYLDYQLPAPRSLLQRAIQVKHSVQSMAGAFPLSVAAIGRRFPASYSTHLLKAGYFYFTDAYAVTPAAARTLAALQTPITYAADHLLGMACTENLVNAFAVKERVIGQTSTSAAENSLTRTAPPGKAHDETAAFLSAGR